LKIAFIGTHGVGKTTLCFELAARLKRLDYTVDLVKEVARDCPLPINLDTTLDAQTWILHTQIAEELASASRHDIVVCDRSVLDNYAYLVHKVGRRKDLDPLIRAWVPTYNALIKVPLWRPPTFDGVRDVGREFQTAVDHTIEELLEFFEVGFLRLHTERTDGWTEQVLSHLQLPSRSQQVPLFPEEP
jgi:nicotinamide riboside kinase